MRDWVTIQSTIMNGLCVSEIWTSRLMFTVVSMFLPAGFPAGCDFYSKSQIFVAPWVTLCIDRGEIWHRRIDSSSRNFRGLAWDPQNCKLYDITACTVVQAVVKANGQSNGKGQILTPWGSETPERISMKLGIYNRVASMPTHTNPCGAATTWVVWANT